MRFRLIASLVSLAGARPYDHSIDKTQPETKDEGLGIVVLFCNGLCPRVFDD